MFTLVGYSQSQDTAGNLTAVNALADPHVRVSGADIIVPDLVKIIGLFALGATISRAQMRSPSLRRLVNIELAALNLAATPSSPPPWLDYTNNPITLVKNEALNAFVAETAVGAEQETVLVILADDVPKPVSGPIVTVRATATTTLVAFAWTNGALTFDQTLPAGKYQIVGARCRSAGLLAFRFVLVGAFWRPGGLGVTSLGNLTPPAQRTGGWGVWGEFAHDVPPTVDFLSSSADTAETMELDLIQVAAP